MMVRRICMAGGIFLTLLLAVLVYQNFSDDSRFITPRDDGVLLDEANERMRAGPMEARVGKRLYIEKTDDDGRIVSIYKAASWKKLGPTTYHLDKPDIRHFRADGQRVFIVAREGVMQTNDVGGKLQIRQGTLEGDVQVVIDRWRDEDHPGEKRSDVADRPADRVKIYTDEIEFNDEDMAISTDGRIAMFSREADIVGSGLTIQWNIWEGRIRELRKFRLERGQYMAIYQDDDLPVRSRRPRLAAPPAPAPVTATLSRVIRWSAVYPALPLVLAALEAVREPVEPAPQPRNIYSATFHKNVRIYQGPQSMRNADTLKLTFNWDMSASRRPRGHKPAAPARQAAGLLRIATVAPNAAGDRRKEEKKKDKKEGEKKKKEPMIIFWDGPLVMRPIGRTDKPEIRKYKVDARGKRIIWSKQTAAAICRRFTLRKSDDVDKPEDIMELFGSAANPARLAQADGGLITSERIMLDQVRLKAEMDGAGYIATPAKDEEPDDPELALALAEMDIAPGGDRISWRKRVNAILGKAPQPAGAGGKTRLFIREAWFDPVPRSDRGRVELVGGQGEDFVRADRLYVRMARTVSPDGKVSSYPVRAEARGGVIAKQQGADIKAEYLDVAFGPPAGGDATGRSAAKEDRVKIAATYIWARGDVHVTDINDKGEKLEISADTLTSNLKGGTATLTGAAPMAQITQGGDRLRGRKILLDREKESVIVAGPGSLRFRMDKDFDGRVLDKPRPVDVSWARHMDFRGKDNEAIFSEDVSLKSDTDTLRSGYMMLTFRKVATSQPASRPTTARRASPRRVGLNMGGMSQRKLAAMVCKDDVVLTRTVLGVGKQVLQSLELKSGNLAYNVENREMRVTGPGSMLSADYEMPAPAAPGPAGRSAMAQKPRQTAFVWRDSMSMTRRVNGGRSVTLDGGVKMRHRSGDRILSVVGAGPLKNLPPGRKTALDCDHLLALFAARANPAAAADMDLGKLEQFIATGSVELEDGPQRLVGRKLDYNRVGNIIVIVGGKGAPATVIFRPSPVAMPKTVRSPRIKCRLDDAGRIIRVESEGMVGGG